MSKLGKFLGVGKPSPVLDQNNRFYNMLLEMQTNRWRITAIVLGLFTLIIVGITSGFFLEASINEDWKEILLILLGSTSCNIRV
jgi:hypothetical protein